MRGRGPGMAGTAEAAEAAEGRREWSGPMGSAPLPAVQQQHPYPHPPTAQLRSCAEVQTRPPPLHPSCIHPQPSCIHILPSSAAISPLSASPRPMAGGPQGGSRDGVGQLAKLNENKMANRCAMRQRPNPKREVPSQPTPAGSSGSCSSWHLRLAACSQPYQPFAVQCGRPAPFAEPGILSFARFRPFLFLISYPLSLSTLPATHAAMVAHAACTLCSLPYRTALEPCIYRTCVAAHIIYSLFFSFYETLTRKPTEIPRLPGPPKIAGFREEPGARLLLNAYLVGFLALLNSNGGPASERCVIKLRYGGDSTSLSPSPPRRNWRSVINSATPRVLPGPMTTSRHQCDIVIARICDFVAGQAGRLADDDDDDALLSSFASLPLPLRWVCR